jgi:acyl-ACP thioesterase
MESMYSDSFSLSDLQCDRFGRLKMSAICWLVQEMAGRHCQQLGLDWETLAQRRLFWAIIRHRVQVERLPRKNEVIHLQTWPMPTTRVVYPRAVVACDSQGQVLFRSTSLWVLMDLDTRAMILPGKSGVEVNGILRGGELPSPPSLHPAEANQRQQRPVVFTDLDLNGHMNNCRYLDWAADLLPSNFHRDHPVSGFTLSYMSEAREGECLTLGYSQNEAGVLRLEIQRSQDHQAQRVFGAELEF